MGWVRPLHRSVVGLDTAPLIYDSEAHPTYLPIIEEDRERIDLNEW